MAKSSLKRGSMNKNPLPAIQSLENLTISEDALHIEDGDNPNFDFNLSLDN